MDADTEIEYECRGQTWRLPRHLAQLQVTLAQADIECRRDDADPDELAAARAKSLELTLEKARLAAPGGTTSINTTGGTRTGRFRTTPTRAS